MPLKDLAFSIRRFFNGKNNASEEVLTKKKIITGLRPTIISNFHSMKFIIENQPGLVVKAPGQKARAHVFKSNLSHENQLDGFSLNPIYFTGWLF